jgi:TP901 family phage tail tape measure protein
MASIAKLVVSLGANISDFQTDMQRAGRISKTQLRQMERQSKRLNAEWNRNFKMAGLAVAGGLALATKAAIDFEKSMAEVSTLLDDTSGLKKTSDAVKKLSVQFGQAPVDTAKALYQIISAGASDAATQMELLTVSNKLAVGGVTDVATAADGLTTVLNAYAGSGLDAQSASDILFTTMRQGKTTIGELSQAIGQVATIAGQTGVGFDELGAAIGTLTKSGIQTTEAVSGIRGVLTAVLKQSDQSIKMAEELGVAFNVTALEAKGLAGFLGDIAATGATSEQLAKLFGRVEGLNAVMSLGANNAKEFTSQLEGMATSAGATETAVGRMMETTAFKAAQATAAFKVLGIEIGERFLSSVSGAATLVVKHIDAIATAIEALVVLVTVRVGVAVTASFLSMATAAGGLATAMAFLGGPVGAALLALTAIGLFIKNELIKTVETLSDEYMELVSSIDATTAAWIRQAGAEDIAKRQTELRQQAIAVDIELIAVREKIAKQNAAFLATGDAQFKVSKKLREEEERLTKAYNDALAALNRMNLRIKNGVTTTADFAKIVAAANIRVRDMRKKTDELWKSIFKLDTVMQGADKRIKTIRDSVAASARAMEETRRETEEYERALQSLLDTLFPVEAAGRQLGENLAILTQEYEAGRISVDRYEAAVRRATDAFSGIQTEAQKTDTSGHNTKNHPEHSAGHCRHQPGRTGRRD